MKNEAIIAVFIQYQLLLIFIYLKLSGHIDWSWWYVTMPVWIIEATLILILSIWNTWIWFDCVIYKIDAWLRKITSV